MNKEPAYDYDLTFHLQRISEQVCQLVDEIQLVNRGHAVRNYGNYGDYSDAERCEMLSVELRELTATISILQEDLGVAWGRLIPDDDEN
jgi:hypothetical protein